MWRRLFMPRLSPQPMAGATRLEDGMHEHMDHREDRVMAGMEGERGPEGPAGATVPPEQVARIMGALAEWDPARKRPALITRMVRRILLIR